MLSDRSFRNLALALAGTAIVTALMLAVVVVEPGSRVHAGGAALDASARPTSRTGA